MAMNREQRRYLQRQGQMDSEGNPVAKRREPTPSPKKKEKFSIREYISGSRSELRKVTWPTSSETLNYTFVVVLTLIFVTALVAVLDFGFAEAVGVLLGMGRDG